VVKKEEDPKRKEGYWMGGRRIAEGGEKWWVEGKKRDGPRRERGVVKKGGKRVGLRGERTVV
jgi:IS4 transposase